MSEYNSYEDLEIKAKPYTINKELNLERALTEDELREIREGIEEVARNMPYEKIQITHENNTYSLSELEHLADKRGKIKIKVTAKILPKSKQGRDLIWSSAQRSHWYFADVCANTIHQYFENAIKEEC